jgi:hypothetical protein
LNYIIRHKPEVVTSKFLYFVENIMHSENTNNHTHVMYSITKLSALFETDNGVVL